MNIKVKKFGGTSVGSVERIQAIAKRLTDDFESGVAQVVVVSAMGDTTDTLVELANRISSTPSPREYDALVSTGESVSAALLTMSLIEAGIPAISLSGSQAGVQTESIHTRARILNVNPSRIMDELNQGKIVVVTGFQGINSCQDITTIGRGGSDTSAVVLAAALGCEVCEIYTDVDGVYTTDPRLVSDAQKLSEISSEEMLELASAGAKVLHPRSVECAKMNNIVLHVRSSFDFRTGTLVKEATEMELKRPVTGVSMMENEAIVSVRGVSDKPGVAGILFNALSEAGINIDMIVQGSASESSNNITFTIGCGDAMQAKQVVEGCKTDIQASDILIDDNVAKISIIGVGMVSKPGVASQMFKALGDHDINIKLITTSEIKVSCAIEREHARKAIEILHDTFELGNADLSDSPSA